MPALLAVRAAAAILLGASLACRAPARHEVTGLVLEIRAAEAQVTVSHDPVPGLMDAMVMPFTAARSSDLEGIRPGDRIRFRLTVDRHASRIDRVEILSAGAAEPSLNTAARPSVPIGSPVPEFTLTDHRERTVALSSVRGKVVVASFIYTRCPLPDYCPRVMTNLSVLRDRFAARLGRDLVLFTVTFDPKHDTPARLKEYADRYGADVPGWHFLTGPSAEIERLCAAAGVEYYPDEGMITHTLQTVVIDREGRLAATAEGRGFSTKQLGDLVEAQLR